MVDTTTKLIHSYLFTITEEEKLRKLRNDLKDKLSSLIISDSNKDDKGNYNLEFTESLHIGDQWYTGLQMQRRVSTSLNEEKAYELIAAKSLHDRCITTTVVEEIDLDELYAANQEGIISDDEIDSLIETDETFALVRIKQ